MLFLSTHHDILPGHLHLEAPFYGCVDTGCLCVAACLAAGMRAVFLSVFEFCSEVLSETLRIFISIVVLVRIDSQWPNR